MDYQGKILVIGASRGIGLAVVKAFAAHDWQVTATHRGDHPPQGDIPQVDWHRLDMTQTEAVKHFAVGLSGQPFDAILINAGIYGPAHQKLSESDDAELAQLFMTNAVAPIRSAEILLPLLNQQNGVLALTSSQLASLNENRSADAPLYSASKAALNMLTRSLVRTVDAQNGTLITLHPGWVKTDMGGDAAPLTPEESANGIFTQLTTHRGHGGHHYLDYAGKTLLW
ncbi:SDR family oxidoreductase [Pantoea allii]|uniref:SDR family oxidoreductase n=1 Tax=Pantoea allii TaxID=574096 RepID=UPI001F4EE26B|nr:SDR family oxidoreductase [Pantoea allii]MCH9299406.1 SDR family oxidoreductase [Pantoea allii]